MNKQLTKTFVENRRYRRPLGAQPGQWEPVPAVPPETPLDVQIAEWVEQTGNKIVHPGQLGMHTTWEDDKYSLKCVTLGLTVLYEQGPKDVRQPATATGLPPIVAARAGAPAPAANATRPRITATLDDRVADALAEPGRGYTSPADDLAQSGAAGHADGSTAAPAGPHGTFAAPATVYGPAAGIPAGARRSSRVGRRPTDVLDG